MPILNVIHIGTNRQWYGRLPDRTALDTRKGLLNDFGPPETLLSDGGSEFKGDYERGCEHWGCSQTRDSSGRSGPKRRRLGEDSTVDTVVITIEDLDQVLHWVVAHKNRFFHRGGHALELFSNEAKDVVGPGAVVPQRGTTTVWVKHGSTNLVVHHRPIATFLGKRRGRGRPDLSRRRARSLGTDAKRSSVAAVDVARGGPPPPPESQSPTAGAVTQISASSNATRHRTHSSQSERISSRRIGPAD